MEDFEINITATGVSVRVKRSRTLRDEATGELVTVPMDNHRQATGIGDFKSADDFQARVAGLCLPVLGKEFAHLTALAACACSERDAAQAALSAALAAKVAAQVEAQSACAQRDDALADVAAFRRVAEQALAKLEAASVAPAKSAG